MVLHSPSRLPNRTPNTNSPAPAADCRCDCHDGNGLSATHAAPCCHPNQQERNDWRLASRLQEDDGVRLTTEQVAENLGIEDY